MNKNRCFGLALLAFLWANVVSGQCSMSCNNALNVALSGSCQDEITFELIIESVSNCDPGAPEDFEITVYNSFGTIPLASSPFVTDNEIGSTLNVRVEHIASGNSCWGSVTISDNLAPAITCPPDQVVSCNQDIDPDLMGYAFALDCSPVTRSFYDTYEDLGCNDPMGIVTRNWLATDAYGNMSNCQQTFTIQQATLGNVTFPLNLDGIQSPALACVNPDTDPSNTGAPTIDGALIPESGVCSISSFYTDQIVPTCGNAYTIFRTWTVLEWCTGNLQQATQVIAVQDNEAPVLSGLDTVVVSANNPLACTGTFILPEVSFTENCGDIIDYSVVTPFGIVEGNGGLIVDVPIGIHLIEYKLTDACGNIGSLEVVLEVIDQLAPTAVCDQITTISLTFDGTIQVPATVFDDGSYDNCCLDELLIRRISPGCGDDLGFHPLLSLCCDDLDAPVEVEVLVLDCSGNQNSCTVSAIVEDKISPTIICPPLSLIACDENFNDLSITGTATATDACGVDSTWFSDDLQLNSCQVGSIYRTWETVDFSGNSASCIQTIELEDQTPLAIFFPEDYTLYGCADVDILHPDLLPAPFDYPTYAGKDCEQVGVNFDDQVFLTPGDACLKIIRTWTLIDWCVYEPNGGNNDGYFQATQTIKILDTIAPVIICPPSQTFSTNPNACTADIEIPLATWQDDCNAMVDLQIETPWGQGAGPYSEIQIGTYNIDFSTTDGCGNTSYCTSTIVVEDQIKPTPYCSAGQIIAMSPMDIDGDGVFDTGLAQIEAASLNEGSFDNCSDVEFSFSQALEDTIRTYNCDQVGTQLLELWVHDAAGNQDFCFTQIDIQDNQFYCNGGTPPTLSGRISTVADMGVGNVLMQINAPGNPMVATDNEGVFEFSDLEVGTFYEIVPFKDENLLDGVTTWDLVLIQRHILGIELLTTPYQIIAGDADGSGYLSTIDIVELQKIIMHLSDELPNEMPSWKFIPSNYQFQDPANPFNENYPESLVVGFEAQDVEDVLFTGVKIGDTNGSAQGAFAGLDDRSAMPLNIQWSYTDEGRSNIEFEVKLELPEPIKIYGLQFALHLDGQGSAALDREPGGALYSFDFAKLLDDPTGIFALSAFNQIPITIEPGSAILRGSMEANTEFYLDNNFLQAEIYLEDKTPRPLKIQVEQIENPERIRVFPNPVISGTEIAYTLLNPELVEINLYDGKGSLVFQDEFYPTEVEGIYTLPATYFKHSGVYWLNFRSGSFQRTEKLVYLSN